MNILHSKRNFDKKAALNNILICLVIGSMVGALLANGMNQSYCDKINSIVQKFFSNDLSLIHVNKIELFKIEFFKNSKIVLFIWLMSFIPLGKFFIMLALFLKAMGYGFTSSVLFSIYKLQALSKILKYILLQNCILIFVFIFISVYSMNYIFQSSLKKNFDASVMFESFFACIMSLLCVFLSSLIEFYFV